MRTTEEIIMVGVDGTPESEAASQWALNEASLRGWSIWFVNISLPLQVADPQVEMATRQSALVTADSIFRDLRAAAEDLGVLAHCSLLFGQVGDVLVDLSDRAKLCVLGHRRGTGLLSRPGSVAATLAAQAHCPTAVIPSSPHPQLNSVDDHLAHGLSRFSDDIVVVVTRAPAAVSVLSTAADFAGRHNRFLNVVSVGLDADGQSSISELLDRLRTTNEGLKFRVIEVDDEPAHEISVAARESWLQVVGIRGVDGPRNFPRGSMYEESLQQVLSPTLLVPEASSDQSKKTWLVNPPK